VYVIGAVPDQLPFVVDSVCPTCADPDTTGKAVFAGGAGTTAVCAELAEAEPTLFVAVTTARIV